MIKIKKFVFSPFAENTYVVWDDESKETMIVDPGCYEPYEEKSLEEFISKNNLLVKYLVNTHCHIDHIFGCRFVKDKFNVPYYAPEKDIPLIQNYDKQIEYVDIKFSSEPPMPDNILSEETKIKLGNTEPDFLFTPGHTPGEHCIYFPEDKICITGDVLFQKSIGRTDLWSGDFNTLIHSIEKKLFTLPDDVIIYPGHGDESTIGDEKKYNPFLNELS